jgi:hypothetical protein
MRLCFRCLRQPARILFDSPLRFFCSVECAAGHALAAVDGEFHWCKLHHEWHAADEVCKYCRQKVAPIRVEIGG